MTQDNQIHALEHRRRHADLGPGGCERASPACSASPRPPPGRARSSPAISPASCVAYRYENGRNLWSDALSRTSISTQVGTLTDVDADPIIDNGRVYALGQGGRMAAYELVTGQRLWELSPRRHLDPRGRRRVDLHPDRRRRGCWRSPAAPGRVRWVIQLAGAGATRTRKPARSSGPARCWPTTACGSPAPKARSQSVDVTDGYSGLFAESRQLRSRVPPIVASRTLYILDDSGRITAWR